MKLFIDLDLLQLVDSPGSRSPVNSMRWKRGDGTPLEVQFCRGAAIVTLPEFAALTFAAKEKGKFNAEDAISCDRWEAGNPQQPVYRATPSLAGDVLNDIVSRSNQPAAPLVAEFSWRINQQSLPVSTRTFELLVENDVVKDDVLFHSKFTATARTATGVAVTRTVIRTSRISQLDADEKAKAAAIEVATVAAANGGDGPDRYLYQVRITEERLIQIIFATGQTGYQSYRNEVARITENRYGAEVLNAFRVMFVDVDTVLERTDLSSAPIISEEQANQLLDDFVAAHPDYGFRVYKTFAGLRYLCTSGLFDPASVTVKDTLTALNADQSYRALCRIQKCFRARLTPKPWRCGAGSGPSFFKLMNLRKPEYAAWRANYLTKIPNFATCAFQRVVGNAAVHPECSQIVALHDQLTQATSGKPLA